MVQRSPLIYIPQELFLNMASMLDVQDIYSLRQTCKQLESMTRDHHLWIRLLHYLLPDLPLPAEWRANPIDIMNMVTENVEHIVASAAFISQRWALPRATSVEHLKPSRMADSILLLDVFYDRWLVCVYVERVVSIWDLGPPYARHRDTLFHGLVPLPEDISWSGVAAAADHRSGGLTLALTKTGGPSITRIINIKPHEHSESGVVYDILAFISHPLPMFVRAIDPSRAIVAFSHSCFIEVYNWRTQAASSISTQTEELDELWNGILGLHLYEGYVICMKVRSIELHSIPSLHYHHAWSASVYTHDSSHHSMEDHTGLTINPLPSTGLVHHFTAQSFRGYSLSSPTLMSSTSTQFYLWGYDVLRGLSFYRVEIQTTSESSVLSVIFHVQLLGEHSLAASTEEGGPSSAMTGVRSRGFVSTCYLGVEGKRGVWIERTRTSMNRSVTVFSTAEISDSERQLVGHVVHEEASYDLHDDLNHCAVCEVSGMIILGTRLGELRTLQV